MSKPEVNVLVGGPVSEPASCQYKNVILKNNLPFAAQVQEPNCIYVIKWDFDLNGTEVTIPENCVLEFDGGSLNNGSVTCQNTIIEGVGRLNCILNGSVANPFDLSLIGVVCDGTTDNTTTLVNFFSSIPDFRGTFKMPINCIYNKDDVYTVIPKGSFLLDRYMQGGTSGGWKSKYTGIITKDDENDDSMFLITSGHFPAIGLVNTGTCEYTEASSDYQKSGLLKKVEIGLCDGFRNPSAGTGLVPRHLFQILGTLTKIDAPHEYCLQFRPLYSFLNEQGQDFSAFTIAANGKVTVNGTVTEGRELTVLPSRYSDEHNIGIRVDNNRNSSSESGDVGQRSLIELRAKDENGTYIMGGTNLNGKAKYISTYISNYSVDLKKGEGVIEIKAGDYSFGLSEAGGFSTNAIQGFATATLSGATPSISSGLLFNVNNAGATTMTNLLLPEGLRRALVILRFPNGNTTIQGNNKIRLKGGLNWTPSTGSFVVLLKDETISANWLEVCRSENIPNSGTTRPTLTANDAGFMFFDTSLTPKKPIWWTGSGWVDATGEPV